MRKVLALLQVLCICLAAPAAASQGPRIFVNGAELPFPPDPQPVIIDGTTFVPLRSVFEALGAAIHWDGATRTVTVRRGSRSVQVQIGSHTGWVNDRPVWLEQPARLINDRTYIPLRFVSEALGATVRWNEAAFAVEILLPDADETSGNLSTEDAQDLTLTVATQDPEGNPVAGVAVSLYREGERVARCTTDEDGTCRFDGLVPGPYQVQTDGAAPASTGGWITTDTTVTLSVHPENQEGSPSPQPDPQPESAGRFRGCVIDRLTGAPLPNVEVWIDGSLHGVTESDGCYTADALQGGWHEYRLWFHDRNGVPGEGGGFTVSQREGQQVTIMATAHAFEAIPVDLPALEPPARATVITLEFDPSFPEELRPYVLELMADVTPVLTAFAGPPVQNQRLILQYDPNQHRGFLSFWDRLNSNPLPDLRRGGTDPEWDAWFTSELYHTWLDGLPDPVPTSRQLEHLGHTMAALVFEYFYQSDHRPSDGLPLSYYLLQRHNLEELGQGLLQTGIGTRVNSDYYTLMNATSIRLAVSNWLTIAHARWKETGQWDFFRRLNSLMMAEKPADREAFAAVIDQAAGVQVEGRPAGQWLKERFPLLPLAEPGVYVRPLPVHGNWWYNLGPDNPNFIYILGVRRAPGKEAELFDATAEVTIEGPDGQPVLTEQVQVRPLEVQQGPSRVRVPPNLPPGRYRVTVTVAMDGTSLQTETSFTVR